MRLGNRVCAALVAAILALFVTSAWAGTIQVDVNDGGCVVSPQGDPYSVVYCSIQDAIDDAADGDNIIIATGTYTENIDITKRLIIQGAGSGSNPATNTVITAAVGNLQTILVDASGASASDRLVIKDIHVTGATGGGNPGSGIELNTGGSYTTIENVTATGNGGHGINADVMSLIEDLQILNCNSSGNTGSGFNQNSYVSIEGLIITDCTMDNNANGTYFEGPLTGLHLSGGSYDNNGDVGIYGTRVNDYVPQRDVILENFTANGNKRGVIFNKLYGPLEVRDCTLNNTNEGITIAPGTNISGITYENITAENNSTANVWVISYLGYSVTDVTINGGKFTGSNYGIYLYASSNSTLSNVLVTNNDVSNNTTGVYLRALNATSTLTDLQFIGNDIINNTDKGILGTASMGLNNEFLFNNIFSNSNLGVDNQSTNELIAENNWWGDASGPTHAGNPGGSGDAVTDYVDYDPWLGESVDSTATEHLTEDPDTLDAKGEANTVVIKYGSGDPWVTAVQYSSNPEGAHAFTAFTGAYIDVHINDDTDVDEIDILLFYPVGTPDEQSLRLHWWDGTEWTVCSHQWVHTTDTLTYGGYVKCEVRAAGTVPTLADLMGTPFGGGGEVQVYVDGSWAGSSHGEQVGTNPDRYFGVNAFATIQLGLDNCASQGTVFVAPGTYNENDTINHPLVLLGSGVGNTIVNTALPGAWVVSDGVTIDGFTYNGTGADTAVFVDNVSYCTIQNCEVNNCAIGILIEGQSATHTRRNRVLNTISRNHHLLGTGWGQYAGSGITVNYSDSCEITDCTIRNLEGSGIDAIGADTLIVDNCTIYDIGNGSWPDGAGTGNGIFGLAVDIYVLNSTFYDISQSAILRWDTEWGITSKGGSIQGNRIYDVMHRPSSGTDFGAISLAAGIDDVTIDSDTLWDYAQAGSNYPYGIGVDGGGAVDPANNIVITNCRIFGDPINDPVPAGGISLTDAVTGITIFNSWIVGNTAFGLSTEADGNTYSGTAINNWWGSCSGPLVLKANANGTNAKGLGDELIFGQVTDNIVYSPWITGPMTAWVDDDYTVTGANDGHTWGWDAFNTVQYGAASVCDGGTVNIRNGTYAEYVTLPDINISILGESEVGVIIDGTDRSDNCFDDFYPFGYLGVSGGTVKFRTMTIRNGRSGIFIGGNQILDIRNCTFSQNSWDGANYDPNPAWTCGPLGDYSIFYNLHIGPSGAPAIRNGVGGDNIKILNCTIRDNLTGISLTSASNCSIAFNQIYDNILAGMNIDSDPPGNNVITGNTVYDNKQIGIILIGDIACDNDEVSNNTVYENWNNGIDIYSLGTNMYIAGNEIFDNCRNNCKPDGLGPLVHDGEFQMCLYQAVVESNYVHDSNTYGNGGIILTVLNPFPNADVSIRYNTITNNTGGTGTKNGVWILATDYSSLIVNYNDIYNNDFGITYLHGLATPDLDARYNWWGTYTGPAQASNTPVLGGAAWVGTGNGVSDDVDYSPWLGNSALIPHNWTYYVNTSNNSTIQEAVDDAWGGDLVLVLSGVYDDANEGVDIDSTLTVRSTHGAEFTIVDPPAGNFGPVPFNVEDVAFAIWNDTDPISVTIDGFTVTGSYIGMMILDSNSDDGYTFMNNIFEANNVIGTLSGQTGAAVIVERSSGYIYNNIIRNNDGAGIRLSNASSNWITDNLIHDNGNYGIFVVKSNNANYTITPTPGVTCANNTISGNEIYNNSNVDPVTYQSYGLIFGTDSGPALPYGLNNLVMDNCFYNNDFTGLYVLGQNTAGSGRMEILRNCCHHNGLAEPNCAHDGIFFANENYHIFASLNTVNTHNNQDGFKLAGTWADIHVNNNNIFDNSTYGFNNTTTTTVDAENNWWGHCSGPSVSTNPGGDGDSVTSYVDYDPWLCHGLQTFTISASPKVRSVVPPGAKLVPQAIEVSHTTTYIVTVTSIGGFDLPVYLSLCQTCCGIEGTFYPNPVTPGSCGSATCTLTVSVSPATPYGDYSLSIVGESPYDEYHSAEVILHVGVAPDFVLTASPLEQTVKQRQSTSYMIMITSVNGFSNYVDLSFVGLPAGVIAGITPGSIIPAPYGAVTAALNIQTSLNTPVGSYPLTITGEDTVGTSSAEVILHVEEGDDIPVIIGSIMPDTSIAKVGSTFTVCISLDDVSDLVIYDIYAVLSFDTTVIKFDTTSFTFDGTCLDSAGTDLKWHYLTADQDSLEIYLIGGGTDIGFECYGCALYLDFVINPNGSPGDRDTIFFNELILNEGDLETETQDGYVIVNRRPQFYNTPPDTVHFQELVHDCFYVYAYDPDGDSMAFWADIPACALTEGASFDSSTQEFCWLPDKTTPRVCDTVAVDFYVKSTMPDSLTDTLSVTIIVDATQIEAAFPDTTWHACGWIEVPVLIDPNYYACLESLAIYSVDMTLCYDPELLTVGEVGNEGLITENWGALTYSVNDEAGLISASMAGNDTLRWCDPTLAGLQKVPILYVGFWVDDEADTGDCAVLCIDHMKFNEGWPTVAWEDAVLKIVTYSLYGSVAYCSSNVYVPDVEMVLTADGEMVQTVLTNDIGYYEFHGLEGCTEYCVTPYKEGIPEQVVTSLDASIILRTICNSVNLSACDSMAADVTGDGTISAFDASIILKYVVTHGTGDNLIPENIIGTWLFVPDSRCYFTDIDTAANVIYNPYDQDFAAVIIGDITGNWPGPHGPKVVAGGIDISARDDGLTLKFAEATTSIGLVVTEMGGLEPLEVKVDGALVEWLAGDDEMRIAAASETEFSEVTVRFAKLTPAKLDIVALIGEGTIFNATAKVIPIPTEYGLEQNYPNPFNPSTSIRYAIPTTDRSPLVTMKIYNVLGQEVKTLVEETKEPGYYTVTWDGRDNSGAEVASGVYFYRINAGAFTQTKKMMMMK